MIYRSMSTIQVYKFGTIVQHKLHFICFFVVNLLIPYFKFFPHPHTLFVVVPILFSFLL